VSATLDRLRDAARALAAKELETDPVPAEILNLCTLRAGKPITVRDTAALEAALPGLRASIQKSYSGTAITWYASPDRYDRDHQHHVPDVGGRALIAAGCPSHYNNSGTIYLDRARRSARWPTVEELKERNARYYASRDERNAERVAALDALAGTSRSITDAAALIESIDLMTRELAATLESLPAEVARVARVMLVEPMKRLDLHAHNVEKIEGLS